MAGNQKKKSVGAWDTGSKGEGSDGKKGLGKGLFGCRVRWVHGFQAECQADWRYLGGLTDGREGQKVDDGVG